MHEALTAGQAGLPGLRARLVMLTGQSVSLGLTLSFLLISSVAILLPSYGSGALPYVYISAALFGPVAFFGFGALQRRWPLPRLASATLGLVIGFLLVTWAGLAFTGLRWLSLGTMLAFSLFIQVGFILIGGQAGHLLDVRQIKEHFPRVVAGFVIGFMLAGALVPLLTGLLGSSEHLLLAAALSAAGMLGFQRVTSVRFRANLQQDNHTTESAEPPSFSRLLKSRYVRFIIIYQMLLAMVTQLVDFMALAAIGSRFPDSEGVARFFGSFTFILNLTDVLFLALAAGFLLSRFGLRLGLAANPVVMTVLLAICAGAGLAVGSFTAIFFYLLLAARVLNISLTDGATRAAVNAAYQALPFEERMGVQTGVEGIGMPVALGLTGGLLLLYQAAPGMALIHLLWFCLLLCLVWLAAGVLVYRGYAEKLMQMLRRRTLDLSSVGLEDGASMSVIERLLDSRRASDVRLSLDLLAQANHPSLEEHLAALVLRGTPEIRLEALARIEQLQSRSTLSAVQRLLADEDEPRLLSAALRTLCALDKTGGAAQALLYLDHPEIPVQEAALVGLLRYTEDPNFEAAAQRLEELGNSSDPAQRLLTVRVIRAARTPGFTRLIETFLHDPEPGVRREALQAAGQSGLPSLLPLILDNLSQPAFRSAAMEALVAYGDSILPLVDVALSTGRGVGREITRRLVRAAGQVGSSAATALLSAQLQYPDHEIRTQILEALHGAGCRLDDALAINASLRQEAQYGLHLLAAQQTGGEVDGLAPLKRALSDEWILLQKRVFLLLRFVYDSTSIGQAEQHLIKGDGSQKAFAIEMMEVNLSADHRSLVFPLVDPELTTNQRIRKLRKVSKVAGLERADTLHKIIENPEGIWTQDWVRACAIYAAARLGLTPLFEVIRNQSYDPNLEVRETALWALERFGSKA